VIRVTEKHYINNPKMCPHHTEYHLGDFCHHL
jgi:hypothetical protein